MIDISGYHVAEKVYEGKKVILYRGSKIPDETPVLFKLLYEAYPAPCDIARLEHEYEINQKVTSNYIVKIHSMENFEKTPVLVMEDFGGQSLQRMLESQQKLSVLTFLQIALKLAEALIALYNNKIIHKDLTPNNIIINMEQGLVKITDFGIATLLSNEQKNILTTQQLEGTLHYISPEQTGRLNRSIDYRTDFYSLGVTFYQMLTGILPFQATDELALIHCHLAKQPPPPHTINPAIPPVISAIIMKLMEKMVENRYQSALGLRADLQTCLDLLQTTGLIADFQIGQQDYSDRLQIPDKLYGREQQLKTLEMAFEQICEGKKIVTMVAGPSGVGKSMLINELRNTVVVKHGYFISGKCDPFQHDIPYSALVHAFAQLIQEILTTSKKQVLIYKEELLQALGANGKILIDVIPEIEWIIGKQPAVIELSANDAKNRFNLVFQNFVRVCCTAEHPVVLFLDNLQWADLATIKLLEVLLSDFTINHLFFISTYKDHEVHDMHPLMLLINHIQKEKIPVTTMFLTPLNLPQIIQLLTETLHCPAEEVLTLAQLSQEKTAGYIFFLNQFLYSLYQDDLIHFDRELAKWQWDLPNIQKANITDNVVELIAKRMQQLPQATQDVLKLASCIGNQFDLKTISILQEKSLQESYDDLWIALQEGLLSISSGTSVDCKLANPNIVYTFCHSHIHQSAYSLLPAAHTKETHLNIGRLLLWSMDWQEQDRNLLAIVNQVNRGIELVNYPYEKEKFAELELSIGRIVKKTTAYDAAYKYFKTGIKLLEESCFITQYDLAFALHIEAAEAAYLNGDFPRVDQYTQLILKNSTILLDKIKAYEMQISACDSQNKLLEATSIGLFALNLLKLDLPKNPTKVTLLMELLKIKFLLYKKKDRPLQDEIVALQPIVLARNSIIAKMGIAAYKTAPNLCLLLILNKIENGISIQDPLWQVTYGMLLCSIGDIDAGYPWGNSALQLLARKNHRAIEAKTMVLFYTFIHHWKTHLKNALPKLLDSYLIGLETGDVNYAGVAALSYSCYSYYAGKELGKLEVKIRSLHRELCTLKNRSLLTSQLIFHQAILNLRSDDQDPCSLCGEIFDETIPSTTQFTEQDQFSTFDFHLNKLMLYYLFGKYEQANQSAMLAKQQLKIASSTYSLPVFYFYHSLALLATLPNVSFFKQQQILWTVAANQRKMKKWSRHAAMNYLHKYHLIKGEIASFLQKDLAAMEHYQKAIALAAEHDYIQEEGLANELAARFHLRRDDIKIAKVFMSEAHYCYTLWGATAKVKQLKEKYSQLLADRSEKMNDSQKFTTYTTTSLSSTSVILDNATMFKATQLISREIILDEILKKLIYILLENAGAERIVYLGKNNNDYVIQGQGWAVDQQILIMEGQPLESCLDLPKKIIYHVEYGKESIILDNASHSDYENDPYIAEGHHKSILCMPVINKGEIIGILYLENNLLEGVFNHERVEILNVITTQLAISLENANLFALRKLQEEELKIHRDHLEELVEERTRELKAEISEREKAQILLEEMATRDTLTGLANRTLFQAQCKRLLDLAHDHQSSLALLFIDLDGFKNINDTFGHDNGDLVLKTVSQRLLKSVRASDIVSRLGGDEFTIIIENPKENVLTSICQRIIEEIAIPIPLGQNEGHITASIGVSISPHDGDTMHELIKKADDAMYVAKNSGKNKFVFS